ncbi:MAG: hypothetical protein IIC50_00170 [Planctomycetes bacterium]|nr:hypothetical protein [Planctomycetota bacterium]
MRRRLGVTLIEVVVASALLLTSLIPILKALTVGQVTARIVDQKTRSLTLAQAKLDEIKIKLIYSFSTSTSASNVVLDGSYLCNVTDDGDSALKTISVAVGFDRNGDSTLSASEVVITLTTLCAKRVA